MDSIKNVTLMLKGFLNKIKNKSEINKVMTKMCDNFEAIILILTFD